MIFFENVICSLEVKYGVFALQNIKFSRLETSSKVRTSLSKLWIFMSFS